ncbi:MAG TPA: cation:proton antiporter [Desulfobacterales bacterium]|nr:cation:proton antiporter [Desulfobacterales bacterium]
MVIWETLAKLVLLLSVAFVLGVGARRLKQSAIIGYLLAGTILGPTLFDRQALSDWGELGVALLLFSIGLEFSFKRLKRLGSRALLGGVLQVTVTLALFALIFSFRHATGAAVAWGAMVAVSSTAIVLRLLMDRAELDSVSGRTALGILLVQDLAVVPLVLSLTVMSHGGSAGAVALRIGQTIAAAGGLVAVFYGLFYHLIPRLLMRRGLFADRELVVLLAIILAFGSAWAAHSLGLSPALGAFLAGMLLAESPFSSQIRADVGSLRTLFVTLFFTSVGMLADPAWFLAHWIAVLVWLTVVFVGKALIIFGIGVILKMSPVYALAAGITLAQIGEFSFVLATEARNGGLIDEDVFSLAVSVTILSMFLAPYMVTYARPLARRLIGLLAPSVRSGDTAAGDLSSERHGGIFIVGFGPSSRMVARSLMDHGLKPEVIELNPASANAARAMGLRVHLGDASNMEILAHAGVTGSCVIVVTVPDPRSAKRILQNVHALSPAAGVIVRSRYNIATMDLWELGAAFVVDEENVVGLEIARQVIEYLKDSDPETVTCALPPDAT